MGAAGYRVGGVGADRGGLGPRGIGSREWVPGIGFDLGSSEVRPDPALLSAGPWDPVVSTGVGEPLDSPHRLTAFWCGEPRTFWSRKTLAALPTGDAAYVIRFLRVARLAI